MKRIKYKKICYTINTEHKMLTLIIKWTDLINPKHNEENIWCQKGFK